MRKALCLLVNFGDLVLGAHQAKRRAREGGARSWRRSAAGLRVSESRAATPGDDGVGVRGAMKRSALSRALVTDLRPCAALGPVAGAAQNAG